MSAMNRVILMGNLTRDPETRTTAAGVLCKLRLAVSERRKNAAGSSMDPPSYVDLVVWDQQAEACAKYLRKGRSLLVEGRLQQDRWETGNGEKRSRLCVRADRIHFLSSAFATDRKTAAGEDEDGAVEPADQATPF